MRQSTQQSSKKKLEEVEEATLESEFSLANEGHKKFYQVDHFLPKRKRDVKEDRKHQPKFNWTDVEIKQLKEIMDKHGNNLDELEQAVRTKTRK